jgi:hypothetical protein
MLPLYMREAGIMIRFRQLGGLVTSENEDLNGILPLSPMKIKKPMLSEALRADRHSASGKLQFYGFAEALLVVGDTAAELADELWLIDQCFKLSDIDIARAAGNGTEFVGLAACGH